MYNAKATGYTYFYYFCDYSVNIFYEFIFYAFRLKIDNNGGAWCPKHMVSRALKEYIQIDLVKVHAITSILTQGRFGKGQGQEYTEAFVIEYFRPSIKKWKRWKNIQGKEVSDFMKFIP